MKLFSYALVATCVITVLISAGALAQDKPASAPKPNTSTASAPVAARPIKSFKNYPDHSFHLHVREYIYGMQKGGQNLLIWTDDSVNLSQYGSAKLIEFNGRLLPQLPPQTDFSYDRYVAVFNSVLKSTLRVNQKESPDALLIEGAVVECHLGSRARRVWVGYGVGNPACAAVCEIYIPGKVDPCVRIYTRDTNPGGGDAVMLVNNMMTMIATRLATTLNSTIPVR